MISMHDAPMGAGWNWVAWFHFHPTLHVHWTGLLSQLTRVRSSKTHRRTKTVPPAGVFHPSSCYPEGLIAKPTLFSISEAPQLLCACCFRFCFSFSGDGGADLKSAMLALLLLLISRCTSAPTHFKRPRYVMPFEFPCPCSFPFSRIILHYHRRCPHFRVPSFRIRSPSLGTFPPRV